MPPGSCAQLALRVAESREADRQLGKALQSLTDRLNRGSSIPALSSDLDRLDMTASELNRRLLTVKDFEPACEERLKYAASLERMRERSARCVDIVRSARADANLDAATLRKLLSEVPAIETGATAGSAGSS
jgi:hypothetical protein